VPSRVLAAEPIVNTEAPILQGEGLPKCGKLTVERRQRSQVCKHRLDTSNRERSGMPDSPPGTPSWVELSSKHPDASATFYGQLMGWSTTEPAQETGG